VAEIDRGLLLNAFTPAMRLSIHCSLPAGRSKFEMSRMRSEQLDHAHLYTVTEVWGSPAWQSNVS